MKYCCLIRFQLVLLLSPGADDKPLVHDCPFKRASHSATDPQCSPSLRVFKGTLKSLDPQEKCLLRFSSTLSATCVFCLQVESFT